MRKEVVWAVMAGITLGLVVAFGVWRINSTVAKNKKIIIVEQTPIPSPTAPSELKIVIDKPLDNDVVTENSINVSGVTKASVWVTFSSETGDYTIQAETSGSFAQEVELSPGVNQIKVTAFDSNGNQNSANILVVYSSSFQLRTVSSGSPTSDASDSSDIRQKVAQDLSNTINRPKAYIGTVTDITDSTIEIKTDSSDIKQISINSTSTNVINDVGTTTKTVKTTDIAIGDFIVAMGYVETNSVLNAQRILITDSITTPKMGVNQAKVVSLTKKTITVSTLPEGTESIVQPDTSTSIKSITDGKPSVIKLGTISKDDTLIYITTTDSKNVTSVRSIFQVQKSQG